MIAYVKGVVVAKTAETVVVEQANFGIRVLIGVGNRSVFPAIGAEAKIWTYLYVREDQMTLYGFAEEADCDLFKQLITVSGIGPKVASTIVADMSPSDFALAVIAGDIKRLQGIKGIGKRTAERMVVELKDKLKSHGGSGVEVDFGVVHRTGDVLTTETVAALTVLGYGENEVLQAMRQTQIEPDDKVETLLPRVLRMLSDKF